jgi:hypothetical protein
VIWVADLLPTGKTTAAGKVAAAAAQQQQYGGSNGSSDGYVSAAHLGPWAWDGLPKGLEAVRRDQALLKSGEQAFVATLGFLAGKGWVVVVRGGGCGVWVQDMAVLGSKVPTTGLRV